MGRGINELTIVKLGGSLITEKDSPLTLNAKNMKNVGKELARAIKSNPQQNLFLIHGGGSFGHYYAKKFHLTTKYSEKIDPEGIAKTCSAMLDLHCRLLEILNIQSVYCATITTSEIFSKNADEISADGVNRMRSLISSGLIPISFGNVYVSPRGAKIISGDKIALSLAEKFRVRRVIFAMDVDGIFPSASMKPPVLDVLDESYAIRGLTRKYDITGGIVEKVKIGFDLAKKSADVFYVSGAKKNRISSLLEGDSGVIATKIYSRGASAA